MTSTALKNKLISVVVPAYNEESCIDALAQALKDIFAKEPTYDFEVIIVEHGSMDRTYEKILNIVDADPRFKTVRLMRNFTCDGGISAGLAHASGEAAIILYADLQDPPELLHQFLRKWEEGYLNVYGIIEERKDDIVRSFNSRVFYWVMNKLTSGTIPQNVGDFRLVDKSLYQAINAIPETNRILRGLFAWSGAKSIGIPYKRKERIAGDSKSNSLYTINFALKILFGFSYFPIYLMTGFGALLSISSFVVLFFWAIKFIFLGVPFDGFGTIISLQLLLFGFLFLMIGVTGKYISMIFEEVKGRPNYIVIESAGFNKNNKKINNA